MEQNELRVAKLIGGGILIFVAIIIIIIAFPFVVINAGERGVVFSNTTGVQEKVLGEGFHFRTPFIESVKTFDVRVQKNEIKATAGSKDLQTVSTVIAVNYHLDAGKVNKIYQSFPDEQSIVDRILVPNTSEVVKSVVAQYTAEQALTKRGELKTKIDEQLTERLQAYHIIVDDVSIVDLDFSAEFNQAIEAKATAEQRALQAENDLRRIEIEADQKVATAKAEAESIRIRAEALAQNSELVELNAVEKWDGKLPQYMLGNTVPFLNLNQ